jgi:tetratricopeptide (TPR) repeat protein
LGELATEEGDYATAPSYFKEALEIFRELEDPRGIGDMLMQLGWAHMRMGNYEQAAPLMEASLRLFREIAMPPDWLRLRAGRISDRQPHGATFWRKSGNP